MKASLTFILLLPAAPVFAGSFLGTGDAARLDRIVHTIGYSGTGGTRRVTVCLEPGFPLAEQAEPRILDAVSNWNALTPTTRNVAGGLPAGQYDFASILMHELGHCAFGLGHVNDGDYAIAQPALDGYSHASGPDGIPGTGDDARGDDRPRSWFALASNDPFVVVPEPSTATMGIRPSQLPPGHSFPATASAAVSEHLGHGFTQGVMFSHIPSGKRYTQLAADEVNTARLAAAGIDELRGTADDYRVTLDYIGLADACDVRIRWATPANASSMLASCGWNSTPIAGRHYASNPGRVVTFYDTHTFSFEGGAPAPTPADTPICEPTPRPNCDSSLDSKISIGGNGRIRASMRAQRPASMNVPDQSRTHFTTPSGSQVSGYGISACLYLGGRLAKSWHLQGLSGWESNNHGWTWRKRNPQGNVAQDAGLERFQISTRRLAFRGRQAPIPPLLDASVTLRVLSGRNDCWGDTWSGQSITKNGKSFKAKEPQFSIVRKKSDARGE